MTKSAPDLHEDLSRGHVAERASPRGFGIVFAAVFAVIGLWPMTDGEGARVWALVLGAAFLVLALMRPSLLAPLNRIWLGLGAVLHRIVNPLVMGLMFFAVITPMALILKLVGKNLLHRCFSPDAQSYWIPRQPPGPEPQSMRNQF
ncbi:MAG: SxtJ family membrane protein [Alphaproteobacteria bacterium]|jgi:hypothetical protein|nr:SxtJ family membrane protein [Alphaproteobacteria bacterium]